MQIANAFAAAQPKTFESTPKQLAKTFDVATLNAAADLGSVRLQGQLDKDTVSFSGSCCK
jgi:hypothetical protein